MLFSSPVRAQLKADQEAAKARGEVINPEDAKWKAEKYDQTPNQLMTGALGVKTNTFRPTNLYKYAQDQVGVNLPKRLPCDQSVYLNGLPTVKILVGPDFDAVKKYNDGEAVRSFTLDAVRQLYAPSADSYQQKLDEAVAAGPLSAARAAPLATTRSGIQPDSVSYNNNCLWTTLKAYQELGLVSSEINVDRFDLSESMELLRSIGAVPNTPPDLFARIRNAGDDVVVEPRTVGDPVAGHKQKVENFKTLGDEWTKHPGKGYPATAMNMAQAQKLKAEPPKTEREEKVTARVDYWKGEIKLAEREIEWAKREAELANELDEDADGQIPAKEKTARKEALEEQQIELERQRDITAEWSEQVAAAERKRREDL